MIPDSYEKLGVHPGDRKPVFAVLRIGKKEATKGMPTDRGRFYVVQPSADQATFQKRDGGTYKAPYRPEHGAFDAYHARDNRRTFRGVLPYRMLLDNWEVRRRAKEIPGYPMHPDTFVTCESKDGETAERLYQLGGKTAKAEPPKDASEAEGKPEDEGWFKIPCPGSLCEFSQAGQCSTRAWLYFIAAEPDLPHVLMRFQTGGQASTIKNIRSFFEDLQAQAEGVNLELTNVAGIPFIFSLSAGVSKKSGRRFPVVTMALDGSIMSALAGRRADAALAGGTIEVDLLPESTETDSEEAKAMDILDAEPSKPGAQAPLFGKD